MKRACLAPYNIEMIFLAILSTQNLKLLSCIFNFVWSLLTQLLFVVYFQIVRFQFNWCTLTLILYVVVDHFMVSFYRRIEGIVIFLIGQA